jgi:phosphotransferase system HPr (HPr) family protein
MQLKQLKMNNKEGLNAKNAALFVKISTSFTSRIHAEKGNKKIDAKSIMGILSLGIKHGDIMMIFIEGEDEKEAIAAIEELFACNFTV